MNAIKKFLADHNLGAHTFVVIWGVADVLWYSNTQFHAYISGLLVSLPSWLHGIVFGLVVPVILYLRTTKPSPQNPSGVA